MSRTACQACQTRVMCITVSNKTCYQLFNNYSGKQNPPFSLNIPNPNQFSDLPNPILTAVTSKIKNTGLFPGHRRINKVLGLKEIAVMRLNLPFHRMTLALAFWLVGCSLVSAQIACPDDHACCKTSEKKKCCSGKSESPALPSSGCLCVGHSVVSSPISGTLNRAGNESKRTEIKAGQQLPATSFRVTSRDESTLLISEPLHLGSPVAIFRLTHRWRC